MKTLAATTDTTFITNQGEKNLRERFRVLIKDTRFFDVLVGYFYTSGFNALYKSLESAENIRILIGISTSKQILDVIQKAQSPVQGAFVISEEAIASFLHSGIVESLIKRKIFQSRRPISKGPM